MVQAAEHHFWIDRTSGLRSRCTVPSAFSHAEQIDAPRCCQSGVCCSARKSSKDSPPNRVSLVANDRLGAYHVNTHDNRWTRRVAIHVTAPATSTNTLRRQVLQDAVATSFEREAMCSDVEVGCRRPGSYASWCATTPNWWHCARDSKPRSMRWWSKKVSSRR